MEPVAIAQISIQDFHFVRPDGHRYTPGSAECRQFFVVTFFQLQGRQPTFLASPTSQPQSYNDHRFGGVSRSQMISARWKTQRAEVGG